MTTTRLSRRAYLDHLAADSARFRAVLADADLTARVPSCPDWDAGDLLFHLGGEVQAFWAHVVRHRPEPPTAWVEPSRPVDRDGLLALFDTASADLHTALVEADPEDEAWSWAPEQTVAFTLRRQAQEAQVHRLDAEQTVGAVTALDPALAADGVEETLGVMYGGCPPWGSFDPGPEPETVRWDLTDTGQAVWTRLGLFSGTDPGSGTTYADEDDVEVIDDPGGEPSARVGGAAADVHAWLWKRRDDAGLSFEGDAETLTRMAAILSQPLN